MPSRIAATNAVEGHEPDDHERESEASTSPSKIAVDQISKFSRSRPSRTIRDSEQLGVLFDVLREGDYRYCRDVVRDQGCRVAERERTRDAPASAPGRARRASRSLAAASGRSVVQYRHTVAPSRTSEWPAGHSRDSRRVSFHARNRQPTTTTSDRAAWVIGNRSNSVPAIRKSKPLPRRSRPRDAVELRTR